MKRPKISIVGAGNVGATLAQMLALTNLADIVLLDIPETKGMPAGKALDILEAGPVYHTDVRVEGGSDWALAKDSTIVAVTAGVARKPGMSRDDLLRINTDIVKRVSSHIKDVAGDAIVIVVSNPLDAMCYVAKKVTGFPRERVLGMAGVLDSARMRSFIVAELKVSVDNVQTMVLGGHGDTMVPLLRYTKVAGIPLEDLLPAEKIAAIIQRTRDGGAEIVKLLETGSAYYAPAASVREMVEAILLDQKKILPCAAYLQGEYGCKDIFIGVPVQLGLAGIEKIIQLKLNPTEEAAFQKSAVSVKELMSQLVI